MNRYTYMQVLLALGFVGAMSGAATEEPSSTQRVIGYFNSVQDSVEGGSEQLRQGIKHFFGAPDAAKDLTKAALSMRAALSSMYTGVSQRAYLYGALLLLVSGDVDQLSYQSAGQIAKSIVYNQHASPIDRVRAYILLDEIMHISNGSFKLDISVLREAADKLGGKQIAQLEDEYAGLVQEFMYRIARSFYYDGPGEDARCLARAVMTLNFIHRNEAVHNASLLLDIDILHARVSEALSGASRDTSSPGIPSGLMRRSPSIEDFVSFEQHFDQQAPPVAALSVRTPGQFSLCPSRALTSEEWTVVRKSLRSTTSFNSVVDDAAGSDDGVSTSTGYIVHENSNQNPSSSNQLVDDEYVADDEDLKAEVRPLRPEKRAGTKLISLTKHRLRKKKFRK